MSFDAGEGLLEKISPFDTFAQVIDGEAEIIIEGVPSKLVKGQGMIIPAHRSHIINAVERFKIIMTIIKSVMNNSPFPGSVNCIVNNRNNVVICPYIALTFTLPALVSKYL